MSARPTSISEAESIPVRQWILESRPVGRVTTENLRLEETTAGSIEHAGPLLVRILSISLDPTNRIWMSGGRQYMDPVPLGSPMRAASSIGVIEFVDGESKYAVGDIVNIQLPAWTTHMWLPDERIISKYDPETGVPLDAYFTVFNFVAFTAYTGLFVIANIKPSDVVVIDAAAGATGSIAVQLAKSIGCKVIGIAGSDEKCAYIVRELGADGAINYKTESVDERLTELVPEGIDVVFENVGGEIMETIFEHTNLFARVAVCGLISGYNDLNDDKGGFTMRNFDIILHRRLRVQGFIVIDHMSDFGVATAMLANLYKEGKMKSKIHAVEGIENAIDAVNMLFEGKNDGRLVLQISHL